MTLHCSVCDETLSDPIYESPDNRSITTMNTLVPGRTQIYFCDACGHLRTSELANLHDYYALEYAINSNSENDDQIYKIVDGAPIFRADHQAAILQSKVKFFEGCKVLDYGCAKAPTLHKTVNAHPGIAPYLFDVTDRYIPFWQRFPNKAQYAVGNPNPDWDGLMDVVLSFYALEHVADLHAAIGNIRKLLKPGGIFYFIVPNAYQNIADFIVADHINHFSESSLRALLSLNGFDNIEIDQSAHDAAFVVCARTTTSAKPASASAAVIAQLRTEAESMSAYWKTIVTNIRDFESALPKNAVMAIYGAGFYANFIASSLTDAERIRVFVDQNPHLQGTTVHERTVVSPTDLPPDVTHILVGLNPRIARAGIESIAAWRERTLNFLFL